jgi:hypothetical protein
MSLVAVCAFFNALDSYRRQRAFARCRASLEKNGVDVLCVEQIFPSGNRVSCETDITVAGGAMLWQKECLLQIGIDRAIRDGYEKILLWDADVMLESPNATKLIEATFLKYDYFQPFDTISMEYSEQCLVRPSAMSLGFPHAFGAGHPGSSWAASARFLKTIRLYPYAILGGGDVAMSHLCRAAIEHGPGSSRFADLASYFASHVLYDSLLQSLHSWASQFESTTFRIGYTAGVHLRSLNHGSYERRRYAERYLPWRGRCVRNVPKPIEHFDVDRSGLLNWISAEDEWLHYVNEYFKTRDHEGGRREFQTSVPSARCRGRQLDRANGRRGALKNIPSNHEQGQDDPDLK